jgi:hypothetical protein
MHTRTHSLARTLATRAHTHTHQGTLRYFENCSYEGAFVRDEREGRGKMAYRTGNVYEGEWRGNERHGKGTMRWLDRGEEYTGDWANGNPHGKGEHIWYKKRIHGSQVCMSTGRCMSAGALSYLKMESLCSTQRGIDMWATLSAVQGKDKAPFSTPTAPCTRVHGRRA